jgi:predicted nuclease of predicted toxin-antitoxin system
MKFLVDENVGRSIVEYLRNQGFDTKSVSELYPSRDDAFIIEVAQKEKRIIITSDKDFGYLVYITKITPIGVILFRIKEESPDIKLKTIKSILKLPKEKIQNHFIVVSEKSIRIRQLN